MLRTPVVLSDTAFDVLWHYGDLGEHHTVLHVPPAETNPREVEQALHREGVQVDDTLEALRVLAATAGRHGVCALRDNGYVRLQALDGDPSDTLAAHLPEMPPGRGTSINARAEEARASRGLAELMQRPRTGAAKLYSATRDRYGRRRRSESFVSTIDCPDGRWLIVRYTDSRGQRWVHATPATRHLITEWVRRIAA